MIDIRITLDKEGNLGSLRAEGHSSAEKGTSIVCAAVSAQLRSVVRVLETRSGIKAVISADKPGFLELFVESVSVKQWLAGVTDVLIAGLLETERDFPEECSIKLFNYDLRS